jgi:hypothetical protein
MFDRVFFGAMAFRLRGPELWPEDFRYRHSLLARKAALCLAGGLAGLFWDNDLGRAVAVIGGFALHLAIYVEWYRWRS